MVAVQLARMMHAAVLLIIRRSSVSSPARPTSSLIPSTCAFDLHERIFLGRRVLRAKAASDRGCPGQAGKAKPGADARPGNAALYFYFRSKEEVLYQIATSALDFTIDLVATEAKSPGSPTERLTNLVRVLTIWHTYNSQVAHVVLYQTGALTTAHLADVAAKQREVSQIFRQVITDGVKSGDFDVPDTGAATIAVLSLCLDVARWYRPGYRLTPQQLGDFNAVAALRIAGGHPAS